MKVTKTYQLNKELPRYPVGSIVYHEFEVLPSRFNDGTYKTDGKWYVLHGKMEITAITYVGEVIDRAMNDHNIDADDWVTLLETKEEE